MRRVLIGLAAVLMVAGTATAQERDRLTAQERRELEQQLRELREQMRELEGKLGREGAMGVLVAPRVLEGPMTFAIEGRRPRLGVIVKTDGDPATDSIGAVLDAVTPDGPAAKAGLQSGDIVVTLKGERVAGRGGSPGDRLIALARELNEGDSVRVAYRRGKEARTAVIVPKVLDDLSYAYSYRVGGDSSMDAARRAMERAMVAAPRALELRERLEPMVWAIRESGRWADMELTTLDADLGSYFGTTEGLLVVRAPKESLLGVKSGDVIVRIGGRVPTSPSHAMRIFRSYEPGDEIRVDIMRNKRVQELKATVPEGDRGLFWEEKH